MDLIWIVDLTLRQQRQDSTINSGHSPSHSTSQTDPSKPENALPRTDDLHKTPADSQADRVAKPSSLWDEAYKKLLQNEKSLIDAFEKYLAESQNQASSDLQREEGTQRQKTIQKLAQDKLDELSRKHQGSKVTVWGQEIVLRKQIQKSIKVILIFKDVIALAVSACSGAALAWSGTLVVLQVSAQNL